MKPLRFSFLFLIFWSLISMNTSAQPSQPSAPAAPTSAVVTIVTVPKPWYAPRTAIVSKMRDTTAQYEAISGLQYKAYTFRQQDSQFGGVYLWKDRAAAQAWFSPAWFERVRKERGVEGVVRYFDAPVVLINQAGASDKNPTNQDGHVISLVTLPIPTGLPREKLISEFNAAIPVYQRVPGLLRKYFVITTDGQFGGIYLWDKQSNAEQWFNAAWHQRAQSTYGKAATLEWFDAPILLPAKVQP
jgi:heme-degrading monooxygenase HmoA